MKMEPLAQIAPPDNKESDDLLLEVAQTPQLTMASTENSSDESDDDVTSTKEQKPLISPSTDIKGDFVAFVEKGLFDGVFAFSNIDGYGTIGLPLSERDARGIASECALKGSANTGIWEIPAEKIHFNNPAWDIWIQKTAGVAASTALTGTANTRPTFTLKKLVIHDKTCPPTNYKEPIGDDETSRKIGDFIVLLPSFFDGAHLLLSHAGQTKTIDFAHESRLSTSVVAAYSGVEHALSSVTAGYRLSLVYDIVHAITNAARVRCPTLSEMQGATQKLHNILLSWKQAASGAAPELLACLLQHRYTQAPTFSAKSLIGADALLVSHLRPLARKLKFSLYLAHVTAAVYIPVMEKLDDMDLVDYIETELHVVDMSGMPVNVDLDLELEDFLRGPVIDGTPDHEKVENDRVMVTIKLYKRTAILIWPKNTAIDGGVSVGDVYDHALHVLQNSLTPAPTKQEAKVVDALLECCRTGHRNGKMQKVMQTLRGSADRWNDVQLLLRALKVCRVDKNADLMGVEGFVSAYQAFGWGALKDFCGEVMVNDPSSTRRRALLSRFAQMGEEEGDAEVSAWCTAQVDTLHRALGKIDASHIPWLMDVATTRGGDFFRDVMIPQLAAQKLDRAFWSAFSKELHQNAVSTPSLALMRDICVSELVRGLPTFPNQEYSSWQGTKARDFVQVLEAIKLCIETKNDALCGEIFTKIRDAARSGYFLPKFPPWIYYAELSPAVIEAMQSSPPNSAPDGVFLPFFVDVVESMVSGVRTTSDGKKKIEPCPLSDPQKAILAAAVRKAGGISVLNQSLGAAGLTAHDSSHLQTLALFIAKEFPRQQMSGSSDVQAYDELVINLVRAIIDTFDTATLVKTSDQLMSLVQFCFEVGARDQCERLLDRLGKLPAGASVEKHVSEVLLPFLPVLKQYLVAQGLDFLTDPYKKFAAAVVKMFAEKVSQRPWVVVSAAQIQAFGCPCADCAKLRAFFVDDQTCHISFTRAKAGRTHLENVLRPVHGWGVTMAWHKQPHNRFTVRACPYPSRGVWLIASQVTKPASMMASVWAKKGKTLLADLGDPATQAAILGGDYSWVHARIHGTDARLGPAPASVPPANAPQDLSAQNLKRRADAGLHGDTGKKMRM
ncbi:hypothetical protein GGX14DRAFT_385542 [Mycena pura]|uniref:Uncharacterized protein n=1 Tax=Mycena pura TaxID=153505 RepID=A0AAD6YQM9_9AGAR|nr:hypothetical protein GGX14DRAFT_385542 [Mycena pura]